MDKATYIIYTDGSFKQYNTLIPYKDSGNIQGVWGSGLHGYVYKNKDINLKTTDVPNGFSITDKGYRSNGLRKDSITVKPYMYLDGVMSYSGLGYIGTAELYAIKEALNYVLETYKQEDLDVTDIIIHTDSEYAITVCYSSKDNKDDLSVLDNMFNANIDTVKELAKVIKKVLDLNINISFKKIKAHSGELGNELADQLAKLSRYRATMGVYGNTIAYTQASKYWNTGDTRHPLLRYNQLFFTHVLRKANTENIYSIMDYKTDVEIGEKTHTAIFGLVSIADIDKPILDVMDFFQTSLPMYNRSIVATVYLRKLFSNRNIIYNNLLKDNKLYYTNNNKVVLDPTNNIVCSSVTPAGIATKAMNYMSDLYVVLEHYRNKANLPNLYITNITEYFYNMEEKKNKTICRLSDIVKDKMVLKDIKVKDIIIDIPITLGTDIPSRNQLKALEPYYPIITLMCYKINNVIEYFIIVDLINKDIGVFCNMYSNKIFIKEDKKKKK